MGRKLWLHKVMGAASLLALATAGAAHGQVVEELVVTAQKRVENVQDVPIAISAFSANALQERAVGNVAQLSNLAPNVTLDGGTPFSGSPSVLSAYVRGIGSDDFAFNIDPGVGIYVDGVYLARTVGANQDLLDVERIEILKGPQGTLFGRNTIGGAISIVTREPGDTFKFKGDVTTGSHKLMQARGSADLPLAEGLSSSITFGIKSRQGYVERIPYPDARARNTTSYTAFPSSGYDTASHEGGENSWNLRGKLKWKGELTKVVLSADYTREDGGGLANTLLATTEMVPGNFAGTSNLPGTAFDPTGTTGFLFAGLYNFCIGATPAQIAARNAQALCGVRGTQYSPGLRVASLAGVNVDADPTNDRLPFDSRFVSKDIDKSYATGNSFSNMVNWGVGGTVEHSLTDDVTVKSITAYRKLLWKSGTDADGSPLNIGQLSFNMKQWQISQELQLLGSALDKKLNYVLGGYYFKEKGSLHDYVTFDEGLLQVDGPNQLETKNYAAFGQVDWRPSELIGVTIGGRYTKEEKLFEGGQQDLNGFNYKLFGCSDANGNIRPNGAFPLAPISCQVGLSYPDPSNPVRVYAPGVNKQTFSNFSPKVGVQLHPADDLMTYVSWSKGYKTGGWTTRLTNPQLTAQPFGEEVATTWEAGFKSKLLDRRLQLNGSVFQTEYDGIQLNFQQGTSPTIRNAGDAKIKGVELEAVAVPLEGLTINASVGYLRARYTDVLAGVLAVSGPNVFQAGTFVGAPLPKTPEWKINLSPRYAFKLANGGSVTAIADWTYTSSIWNNAQRTYVLKRPAVQVVNASVAYADPDGAWSVTVGGTNLTDKRYLTTGNENIAAGAVFGTYSRPREAYVRLGVTF
ncbi:TonB-dependent receptor [Caulobacter vibrioides]|uniref:TonB-dependent receptor n=2 Tax=Caulobacter vibrioides TaxID=155892 RepID=Q9A5P9_CAUVC|nr:TonB-dependent receptor [Caulobacter vibrioides]YP_002517854.1 TonB-dependent receptor [Caulobacter vibrioides NA1000]AAK24369.1 TonB-dependent receptor [Caulobacter vibrioides CB15]ACL95946.1 TonB-dependent receptor [Caulobacter vibrioides NA1000]ATC29253.1 TonB-dependent receptor [Caulobacter vibrioides]QXZ50764.1 TonB-dependent receptor [Caulobacter vibrioides]